MKTPENENAGETGKVYGYARVSTREQNLDRQLKALDEFGVPPEQVFADKASGADFNRPEYQALLKELSEGDVLVVKSVDRLGRDYDEILEEWRVITKVRGVHVVVLDIPLLDTRNCTVTGLTGAFLADIVLELLSYIAHIERENLLQRQAEGIAAAHARGVKFGRPRKEQPENFPQVRASYFAGDITRVEAAASLGVSERTFSRWVNGPDAANPPARSGGCR